MLKITNQYVIFVTYKFFTKIVYMHNIPDRPDFIDWLTTPTSLLKLSKN